MTSVVDICSNAIRGALIAAPGHKLVVSDLSGIESRVLPWLAGEEWKLEAFREFDAGRGAFDNYVIAYAKAFRINPSLVTGWQRQVGKVMELFLGYEGGVGAFVTGAATYGIDLAALAARVELPVGMRVSAESTWEWAVKNKRTFGLSREVYVACDGLKQLWRQAHPATTAFWPDLKGACLEAVQGVDPIEVGAGRLGIDRTGNWLRIRLPSGRFLCYPSPRVSDRGELSYMGVNQYSKQWARIKTYGGKLAENITQAVARDVLAAAMPRAEAAGYPIVLHVHDELVCEVPDNENFLAAGLDAILATNPPWATDLPLAAHGFETYRYRK